LLVVVVVAVQLLLIQRVLAAAVLVDMLRVQLLYQQAQYTLQLLVVVEMVDHQILQDLQDLTLHLQD
jgi:hypothetical protein